MRSSEDRVAGTSGSRFQDGDILMARISPCLENGKLAQFRAHQNKNSSNTCIAHGSTEFIVVRGRPGITDNTFAYYLVSSPQVRSAAIAKMTGSTGRQRVPVDALRDCSVCIPSLLEQLKIAKILGSLDDKIELNRQMNETLESIARTLFKSWFVDFDPVRAKAEGRKPEGMSEEIAALFPESFEESELGPIPKGWKTVVLSEVAEINPKRIFQGEIAPFIQMADIPINSCHPIKIDKRKISSGSRFVNGDVLFARITPCLENGKTAFVNCLITGEVAFGSTEFIVLSAKSPLPAEFVYCLARSERFRGFAIANMTGSSGRQRVPTSCLENYRIALPGFGVIEKFGQLIQPMFELIHTNWEINQTLTQIRDLLLPRLISGEIRVPSEEGSALEKVGPHE